MKLTQWNFSTHSDRSVGITDPKRHLKPWSEMWLTPLEILHQLSIRSLFEKFELRQVLCYSVSYWKLYISIMSFQVTHFASQNWRSLNSKKMQKSTTNSCQKDHFWPFTLHDWTFWWRQKMLILKTWKKLSISRFQCTFFLSVRICKN